MSGRLGRWIWHGRTPDLRSLHKILEYSLPMRNTCARTSACVYAYSRGQYPRSCREACSSQCLVNEQTVGVERL